MNSRNVGGEGVALAPVPKGPADGNLMPPGGVIDITQQRQWMAGFACMSSTIARTPSLTVAPGISAWTLLSAALRAIAVALAGGALRVMPTSARAAELTDLSVTPEAGVARASRSTVPTATAAEMSAASTMTPAKAARIRDPTGPCWCVIAFLQATGRQWPSYVGTSIERLLAHPLGYGRRPMTIRQAQQVRQADSATSLSVGRTGVRQWPVAPV
jgi:DNA-binding transcriptional regulator YiaG